MSLAAGLIRGWHLALPAVAIHRGLRVRSASWSVAFLGEERYPRGGAAHALCAFGRERGGTGVGRRFRDGRGVLVVQGEAGAVSVPVEVAASYRARTKGLLGRDGVEGAMLLSPANSVHTFRMRMAIDVAYLDRDLVVIAVRTMKPGRLGLPRVRARHVVEADAGVMAGWGLRSGVRVEVVAEAGAGSAA